MQEIPENWISIEQKEDFKLSLSSDLLLHFNKSFLKILFASGYNSEEKIKEFLKTPQGIDFYKSTSQYSELFLKILINRGINTIEKINYFLKEPQGTDYHDPFLLPNMAEAVERILKAIKNKENILIFGDYDADGVISTVLIYSFLKKLELNPIYNIPDRVQDGYDINLKFIKKLRKKNPEISLIICVDCGSNSHEVRDFIYADNSKLDVIVCDHHRISEKLVSINANLNKYIIVNPQDPDSKYNFKFLSGAGVTFKFIHAILSKLDKNLKDKFEKSYLTDLLDLVAISTIADLMPLIDENRIIVKKGLKVLKNTKNPGLKTLIKSVLPQKEINNESFNTYDIGFIIAPRINAPGRVEEIKKDQDEADESSVLTKIENNFELNIAKKSFELLTCSYEEAQFIVNEINKLNEKRKREQTEMLNAILNNEKYDFVNIQKDQKIFIEKSKNWSEGLLGIVASDLVKKYNIPVILFKESEDSYKGSGRSIEEFDLFENLNTIKNFFNKFGGHKMACGLLIKSDSNEDKTNMENKFKLFKQEMIRIAKEKLSDVKIQKKFYYDFELEFDQIKPSFGKELKLLEPFGIGNAKPVFLTRNCFIKSINFLKDDKHISLQIKNKGIYKKAIFFNVNKNIIENLKNIPKDIPVSLIFNIEENNYEKNTGKEGYPLQLVILDLFYKIDINNEKS
ncbi:MAG: single-stranded-DNA-specific exonuclease RecJ [Actinobacteria bacterium]|nr:single-stranded-DNA-specific exonuclease RecJ [Actinomycetota bacterium]